MVLLFPGDSPEQNLTEKEIEDATQAQTEKYEDIQVQVTEDTRHQMKKITQKRIDTDMSRERDMKGSRDRIQAKERHLLDQGKFVNLPHTKYQPRIEEVVGKRAFVP